MKADQMPSRRMDSSPPVTDTFTDTVIVGNGPSAMILSYILHGHVPLYSSVPAHPDHLLHSKLKDASQQLLNADVDALTDHFAASRLSYSTQALPVNVLLDTLVCPSVDVEEGECVTNLRWQYVPHKAVPHLVFGIPSQPGGQWTDNPVACSGDIQTLSYASMLSLPGYCYAQHYRNVTGMPLPAFNRPTRYEFADYLRAYTQAVQIDHVFRNGQELSGISRTNDGLFYIQSHRIHCKHIVLASGIFSEALRPPLMLRPLLQLRHTPHVPLLVIGSGFSAADAIISAPNNQKIIHLFKWDPDSKPSPLHGCHQQAYPEYAGIYRLMKRAALTATDPRTATRRAARNRRKTTTHFLESRNWDEVYEGLPNADIVAVDVDTDNIMVEGPEARAHTRAMVTFRLVNGTTVSRPVSGLVHAVGRRGSLRYLDDSLRAEVLELQDATPTTGGSGSGSESGFNGTGNGSGENKNEIDPTVSGQTLRSKAVDDLEVAPDIFIIGSLTGDSLIRFAYGGCVYVAGKIIRAYAGEPGAQAERDQCSGGSNGNGIKYTPSISTSTPRTAGSSPQSVMIGIDGHHHRPLPGPFANDIHEKEKDDGTTTNNNNSNNNSTISTVADRSVLPSWWRSLVRLWRWD